MGQLESLRELSITHLAHIYKIIIIKRRKYALVVLSNGQSNKF
jgi:hypothetical protein